MLGNVADLIKESVTSNSLLNKSAEVHSCMAGYTVVVVEDTEAHEDAAEAVAQPLCLVMLVRPNLVENEGEGVRGGEEERNSLWAAGNPGTQELEQAKSEQKKIYLVSAILATCSSQWNWLYGNRCFASPVFNLW